MSGGVRRIDVRDQRAEDLNLASVVEHLMDGGILGHPTETVYGFGCAVAPAALDRLFAFKRRSVDSPVLLLVPGPEAVSGLAWTADARELAEVFWPGSVTLLLRDPDGLFPPGVRSPGGAVGVRQTAHPLTARVVELLDGPMTSTSANAPGEVPALRGGEVVAIAEELGADEDVWILDAGTLPPSPPSTIVDCTGEVPGIRRAGATPVGRLRCLLPEIHDVRDS